MTPRRERAIRRGLLAWFQRRESGAFPGAARGTPTAIWVSEIMLQQTTVEAVRRRYDRFLARFPTLASLARAREDSVLAAWSGLGYYARARNLRPRGPRDPPPPRRRLPARSARAPPAPGFGDYTAAAVASIAFGARAPAADANVTRVVSASSRCPVSPAHARTSRPCPRSGSRACSRTPGRAICSPR